MIVFKIVNDKKGELSTLYHGVRGSKKLPRGKWIRSERKWGGENSNRKYWTGFHCLATLKECRAYFKKFRNKKGRKIISCEAKGVRTKPTNPKVLLASHIKIS